MHTSTFRWSSWKAVFVDTAFVFLVGINCGLAGKYLWPHHVWISYIILLPLIVFRRDIYRLLNLPR